MHVAELEWGAAHMHDAAADILHDGPLDFVLAADFLYPVRARLHPPSIVLPCSSLVPGLRSEI